jgi:3-hydroxymyristoyl/3-hydroxydecanoyl-(acyl carrier protein) dehydratase
MAPRIYDIQALQALLPHRYPFLLVDRIEVAEPGQRVVGTKRLTGGEWWMGQQRWDPIPFTLVLEALAQTGGALIPDLTSSGSATASIAYFMGADRIRLRRPATIGDELRLEVTLRQWRRGVCRTRGVASVAGAAVLTADLTTIVRAAS